MISSGVMLIMTPFQKKILTHVLKLLIVLFLFKILIDLKFIYM